MVLIFLTLLRILIGAAQFQPYWLYATTAGVLGLGTRRDVSRSTSSATESDAAVGAAVVAGAAGRR
jgi:hypothetical protein